MFYKVIKLADINLFTQKALKKYVPRSDGTVDEQVCRGIDNLRGKEIRLCKKEISIDKDGDIGQKKLGGKSKDNSPNQCMAALMMILTDYDRLTMQDYGYYMMTMTKRTWETNPRTMLQTGNPPREDSRHWWIQSRMNISCRLRIILKETSMKGGNLGWDEGFHPPV